LKVVFHLWVDWYCGVANLQPLQVIDAVSIAQRKCHLLLLLFWNQKCHGKYENFRKFVAVREESILNVC